MTARLDPIQLDQAWDARLLGGRYPLPVDDIAEWELLELLSTPLQQAPRPAFVQALERELNRSIGPDAAIAPAAGASISMPRFPHPAVRRWQRLPSRWMTAGYALAAIALVVFLSSFAIAWQHRGNDNGPAIPAVSEWTDAGPPTSPGVETNTLFSHTFSVDELAAYSFDRWGWVQFVQGTVEPHQYSTTPDGLQGAMTMSHPGISFIEVEHGELTAHLDRPALVGNRTAGGELAQVQAGADVTLGVGDTLVFGLDSLAQFWNPTSEEASYVAGGLYIRPDDPIVFPGSEPQDVHTGTSFDTEKLAGVGSLTIAMDQVTIGPGETYAYAITPQTLLLGNVTGEGLILRGWSNSARDETARTLSVGMHTFHRDNPGYYTFTNNGTEAVDVYLMRVAPPATAQAEPDAPTSSVSTLFEKTLTPDEMTAYESEAWKWIGMSGGTMPPGSKAVIVEGSPVAGDIGFDGAGRLCLSTGTNLTFLT